MLSILGSGGTPCGFRGEAEALWTVKYAFLAAAVCLCALPELRHFCHLLLSSLKVGWVQLSAVA